MINSPDSFCWETPTPCKWDRFGYSWPTLSNRTSEIHDDNFLVRTGPRSTPRTHWDIPHNFCPLFNYWTADGSPERPIRDPAAARSTWPGRSGLTGRYPAWWPRSPSTCRLDWTDSGSYSPHSAQIYWVCGISRDCLCACPATDWLLVGRWWNWHRQRSRNGRWWANWSGNSRSRRVPPASAASGHEPASGTAVSPLKAAAFRLNGRRPSRIAGRGRRELPLPGR